MKLDDVIARALRIGSPDEFELDLGPTTVRTFVERVLAVVDLHVAADGEVYSPAPAPPLAIENVPKMNAARYGGRTRRRR